MTSKVWVAAALVGSIVASSVQAKEVAQTNPECRAREMRACVAAQMSIPGWNINSRAQYFSLPQNTRNAIDQQIFEYTRSLSNQTLISCDVLVDASGRCVEMVDIPTAAEVDAAVQKAQDETLKAWLAALEARGWPLPPEPQDAPSPPAQ